MLFLQTLFDLVEIVVHLDTADIFAGDTYNMVVVIVSMEELVALLAVKEIDLASDLLPYEESGFPINSRLVGLESPTFYGDGKIFDRQGELGMKENLKGRPPSFRESVPLRT